MLFFKSTLALATAVALGAAALPAAAVLVNPAIEYTTATTLTDSRAFTLGYQFTISSPMSINALGYWDDGKTNNHQVGLWTTGGTLITSATVLGTDTLVGHFRYADITDILLPAGSYVIGGEFLGNNDALPFDAQGVTRLPGVTWDHDLQLIGGGLNFPTVNTGGGYGDNGILQVTFSVGNDVVPAPMPLALIATGLLALGALRRRAR